MPLRQAQGQCRPKSGKRATPVAGFLLRKLPYKGERGEGSAEGNCWGRTSERGNGQADSNSKGGNGGRTTVLQPKMKKERKRAVSPTKAKRAKTGHGYSDHWGKELLNRYMD